MDEYIEGHEVLLSSIKPCVVLARASLNNFLSNSRYRREVKFLPSERYPHGATASGMLTVTPYPEGNGYEALIEDHKYFTQNDSHTYQAPRKIAMHAHQDKEGYGHIIFSSNYGTNLQGVVSKATDHEFEYILHGMAEHLGQKWIKAIIKKEEDGIIHGKYYHCDHHDNEFIHYQDVTNTPIS